MSAPTIHPVAAAEIESSRVKPTLEEMLDLARSEAGRIATVQRGLIDTGHREKPDGAQIRRMVVAFALARWIERERRGAHA